MNQPNLPETPEIFDTPEKVVVRCKELLNAATTTTEVQQALSDVNTLLSALKNLERRKTNNARMEWINRFVLCKDKKVVFYKEELAREDWASGYFHVVDNSKETASETMVTCYENSFSEVSLSDALGGGYSVDLTWLTEQRGHVSRDWRFIVDEVAVEKAIALVDSYVNNYFADKDKMKDLGAELDKLPYMRMLDEEMTYE